MPLTDLEFRACHIILSAARREALFDEQKKQMRREGIAEQTWRYFYQKLGFKILVAGKKTMQRSASIRASMLSPSLLGL